VPDRRLAKFSEYVPAPTYTIEPRTALVNTLFIVRNAADGLNPLFASLPLALT
jgi:hypothetical protein